MIKDAACNSCGAVLEKAICEYCKTESDYLFLTEDEYFELVGLDYIYSDNGKSSYMRKEIVIVPDCWKDPITYDDKNKDMFSKYFGTTAGGNKGRR